MCHLLPLGHTCFISLCVYISQYSVALTIRTFVGKVMSLLFNMLSRLVIAFLQRNKHLLISWLQSPSAVILESKKISLLLSTVSPSICRKVMGPDAMVLVFWMLSFKSAFYFPLSLSSRGSLVLLLFLPKGWCHLPIWGYWYFSRQSWFQLVLHPAQRFSWRTLHIGWISRVTIYSLDVLLSQFGTSLLLHDQF